MAIDIYSLCPAQTGKKIKFCCGKDVCSDLDQIYKRIQSNQLGSAVSMIDRAIESRGEKDCLLILKTSILISLGEFESAASLNEAFLEKQPTHPVALQHAVQIAVRSGRFDEAVSLFQDAMEAIDDVPPAPTSVTARDAAMALFQQGKVIAALAHIQFAQSVANAGEGEERLVQLFSGILGDAELNHLLKHPPRIDAPDTIDDFDSQPWAKSFANVHRLMNRGQFRRALKLILRIDEKYPDVPCVIRAIPCAMLASGQHDGVSEALKKRAHAPTTSLCDQLASLALAHFYGDRETVDLLRLTFEITDVDRFNELATTLARLLPQNGEPAPEESGGPPPRNSFIILDKDPPAADETLTIDNATIGRGILKVFGKQTDREARIEIVISEEHVDHEVLRGVLQHFGETIGDETERIVEASMLLRHNRTNTTLNLGGRDLGFNDTIRLEVEHRTKDLIENYCTTQFQYLGGKSIAELAKSDPASPELLAAMLLLEFEIEFLAGSSMTIDSIYDHYKIKPIPLVPADTESHGADLFLRYVDATGAEIGQLKALFTLASITSDMIAMDRIAAFILEHDLSDEVEFAAQLYEVRARLTTTLEDGAEFLQKAKNELKAKGLPYGRILVSEFDYFLGRGETEKLEPLFERIKRNHLSEPGVEMQMTQVLNKYGLLHPQPGNTPANPTAPVPPEEPAAASAEPETGGSGLWLPGQ